MSETPPAGPITPPEGSLVMMPILQSPTRTTLFPDASVVATAESGDVDLVFLRRELVAVGQQGQIGSGDAGPMVEVKAFQFQTFTHDIGHVRMSVDSALDLAANILVHVRDQLGVSADQIADRLQVVGIVPK